MRRFAEEGIGRALAIPSYGLLRRIPPLRRAPPVVAMGPAVLLFAVGVFFALGLLVEPRGNTSYWTDGRAPGRYVEETPRLSTAARRIRGAATDLVAGRDAKTAAVDLVGFASGVVGLSDFATRRPRWLMRRPRGG
jgi:hypothetical protein